MGRLTTRSCAVLTIVDPPSTVLITGPEVEVQQHLYKMVHVGNPGQTAPVSTGRANSHNGQAYPACCQASEDHLVFVDERLPAQSWLAGGGWPNLAKQVACGIL